MHSPSWQAVCGFFTDIYESLDREDVTFRHIFEMICQHKRSRLALWTENGKKHQMNYEELPTLCAGAALQLDRLVPDKTGVIALHMANSAMWPVLFWGILMSGHTPFLLNSAVPLKAFEPILEKAGVKAVISCDEHPRGIHPQRLLGAPGQTDMALFESRWADQVIFMTSGTSGVPKLVVYTGRSIARQIQSCRYFYRETAELAYPRSMGAMRQLALLPFSHIFGFIICMAWYPFMGAQIIYPASMKPDAVLDACQKMHVTHLCAVPSYFEMIARYMLKASEGLFGKHAGGFISWLKEGRLQSPEMYQRYQSFSKKLCTFALGDDIRYMISGGGMLSPSTAAFFNRLGLYFCNGYGMTELGILAVEKSDRPEKRMQASIGAPSYGVKFTLDEQGEIWVDCDYAAAGYLEEGGLHPLERPFSTKDLGRMLPDGRYMLLGRHDDIIIDSDGNRIHPNEIEERLRRLPGVTGLCVIQGERKLVLLLEGSPEGDAAPLSDAINRVNRRAQPSHYLHEAWLLPRLPRTSKGEVDRRAMTKAYQAGLENAVPVPLSAPSEGADLTSPLVISIRSKVAELLNLSQEQVFPGANFFSELGMDSLTYMCLVQWMEEQYHVPFVLPDQQRFETIYECVDFVQNKGGQ